MAQHNIRHWRVTSSRKEQEIGCGERSGEGAFCRKLPPPDPLPQNADWRGGDTEGGQEGYAGKKPYPLFSNEPSSLKCCSGFVSRSAHHFIQRRPEARIRKFLVDEGRGSGGGKRPFLRNPHKRDKRGILPDSFLSLNQSSLHEFLEQQLRRHGDGVDGDAGRVEDGVAERRGRADERRLAERLVAVYA